MLFQGKAFTLNRDGDTLELRFDQEGSRVNVFNRPALDEFGEALETASKEEGVDGLILTQRQGRVRRRRRHHRVPRLLRRP